MGVWWSAVVSRLVSNHLHWRSTRTRPLAWRERLHKPCVIRDWTFAHKRRWWRPASPNCLPDNSGSLGFSLFSHRQNRRNCRSTFFAFCGRHFFASAASTRSRSTRSCPGCYTTCWSCSLLLPCLVGAASTPASNSAPMKMKFLEILQSYDSINFNASALVIAHCRKSRAVHMILMACRVFGKRVKYFSIPLLPLTAIQNVKLFEFNVVHLSHWTSHQIFKIFSSLWTTNLFRHTPLECSSFAGTIDRLAFTDSAVSLSKAAFSGFLFLGNVIYRECSQPRRLEFRAKFLK